MIKIGILRLVIVFILLLVLIFVLFFLSWGRCSSSWDLISATVGLLTLLLGEFHLRCILNLFILVLFNPLFLDSDSSLFDFLSLLVLKLLRQVVRDLVIDRNPVKIVFLRHFEHLPQVARFKA